MTTISITDTLVRELDPLRFSAPVTHVYNPLVYARAGWDEYLRRYGDGPRAVVLVGMNPGPFGMAQTGVPFGDVPSVRDWMEIEAPVERPAPEHPKRPILGFACPRREVSGSRLWGWARDTFGEPGRFFRRFFVANYCPLCFMEASGRNRTPDKLPADERDPLYAACDRALRALVETFGPQWVLGIGAFAEDRARAALEGVPVRIGRLPHPSPANPAANRGWADAVMRALESLGVPLDAG